MYIDEANKKYYDSVKQTKDKTCITLIVVTSASEKNVPLDIVGKLKNIECLKLMDGTRTPFPYKNKQKNAWFDQKPHYSEFSMFSGHITSALKAM